MPLEKSRSGFAMLDRDRSGYRSAVAVVEKGIEETPKLSKGGC